MRRFPWTLALLFAAACGPLRTGRHQGASARLPPGLSAEELRGPAVRVDPAKLGPDRSEACRLVEPRRVPAAALARAASRSGILPDDLEAIRRTADREDATLTFRDSNPACGPHLAAGVESKGHDVMTKTFTAESLPPEFKGLAGTVSTLAAKPGPGEVISDPMSKRRLGDDGGPLTCDYDLMDMFASGGNRIAGESGRDLSVREALNRGLPPRGSPPRRVDRIKHGAQAEYPNYLRVRAAEGHPEPPVLSLFKPEAPLTAFDEEGSVFRLESVEDALNYYRCLGAGTPAEWDIDSTP